MLSCPSITSQSSPLSVCQITHSALLWHRREIQAEGCLRRLQFNFKVKGHRAAHQNSGQKGHRGKKVHGTLSQTRLDTWIERISRDGGVPDNAGKSQNNKQD